MSRVYSHSQLETFSDCPKRYAYRYVWRQKSTLGRGIEGFMGNCVHSIIERTFHHFAHHGVLVPLTKLLREYELEWKRQRGDTTLRVANRGRDEGSYLADGRRALVTFHERAMAGAFSMTPFAVERPLHFTAAGRSFAGVIDYLGPAGAGIIEIRDWKTGKAKDTSEDRQLPLYELGLRQTYDESATYDLVHEFLTYGVTRRRRVTGAQLQELAEHVSSTCSAIEAADVAGGPWPAKPSGLCGWCDYSDVCEESRVRSRAR